MFAKTIVIACIQLALFNVISSQVIKGVLPSCGCGCGGVDVISSPLLLNQPGFANVIPGLAPGLVSPYINGQYALPAANIIQDNSVANNLANTLQLLLVSNLLSNTLPASPELILPSCSCGNGVSYIF